MSRSVTLTFLGAARTVTGSRFLLRTGQASVLIDCGLFQGPRALRDLNWTGPSFDPSDLDAVVLTHAHLDHVGYLPVLVKAGFAGAVHSARWTPELGRIVLIDSGHLQEEEASYANRVGYSKHHPALPLYTQAEAEQAAARLRAHPMGAPVEVADGVQVTFNPAGHILGSAVVTVEVEGGTRLLFSGDLGRPHHPILVAPDPPGPCHVEVIESTYGDRRHEDSGAALERLARTISDTARRGGTVVVPAFAVDRTEVLLVAMAELAAAGRIPELPVYVDSPMASAVLGVYRRAIEAGDPQVRSGLDARTLFHVGAGLHEATGREDSMAIDALTSPSIVVSSSGMATGGRVLHHLARRLPDHRNSVILAGYQAVGTRGRSLADGARALKMHGRYVPVRAEVVTVDAFSVHADADELVAWAGRGPDPGTTYVVHGEPSGSETLARRLDTELDRLAVVPNLGETVRIS